MLKYILLSAMVIYKTISGVKVIVGAGISGLSLANKLSSNYLNSNNELTSIIVLEKSKGYGGRMATRRFTADPNVKFDHGAQYYSLKEESQFLHEIWKRNSLSKLWQSSSKGDRYVGTKGMSALARQIGLQLDVKLNHRVTKLQRDSDQGNWLVHVDGNSHMSCSAVIVTSPLPQALELLDYSGIRYDPLLSTIRYAKALVALCTNTLILPPASKNISVANTLHALSIPSPDEPACIKGSIMHYLQQSCGSYTVTEPSAIGGVHNIFDQQTKGISRSPAYTIIMHPDFSETHYESTDDLICQKINEALDKLEPEAAHDQKFSCKLKIHEIKRWKYSHPLSSYPHPFVEVAEGLFLAGDAFGGGSINGAIRSATELYEKLVSYDSK